MLSRHWFFSIVMTVATLVVTFGIDLLWRWVSKQPFSFEDYTFSLVIAIIMVYFYNISVENDNKKEQNKEE